MTTKTLTWTQITELILPNSKPQSIADLSSLITKARQKGIGKQISFQKTEYTEEDVGQMKVLISWWHNLNSVTLVEFRDKAINDVLQDTLLKCLITNQPLFIYSVFCPSYRKGDGAIGYTGITGNHTKRLIKEMSEFIYQSNDIGIDTRGIAFFSDLLLENYELLKNTDYKTDLENNFEDFKAVFKPNDPQNKIEVKLLSEIESFATQIGEAGIESSESAIPKEVYEIVFNRNEVFYKNELGWDDQQIAERTNVLARCYAFMGGKFRKLYPQGLMFWVESAYERGRMYSGMNQDTPLPIIYPVKHD